MLSEKQFRDRAVRELREIGKQVQSLATDRDLYRKLEADVVPSNPRLSTAAPPSSAWFAALTPMRPLCVCAACSPPTPTLSLRRLLTQISEYPELLHDKLTAKELSADIAEFDRMERISRSASIRTSPATNGRLRRVATANRELDRAIDFLIDCVKRYYWIVSDSYIDLDVSYSGRSFGDIPLSLD